MKTKTIDIITTVMAAILFIFDLVLVWADKADLKMFLAILVVSIVLTVFKNEKLTKLISGAFNAVLGSYFKQPKSEK